MVGDLRVCPSNFKTKEMQFTWNGQAITLKGISSHGELKTITVKALYKSLSKNPNVLVGANLNDKWVKK